MRWVLASFMASLVGFVANAQAEPTPRSEGPEPFATLSPAWKKTGEAFRPELRVHLSEDGRRGFLSFEHGDQTWNSRVFGMWKALIADLDGDGSDELILGIWSSISRHKEPLPSRAIWVMRWDESDLVPVWRGSAMSRPLVDFWIHKRDDGSEVRTLETHDNRCFETSYTWTGFGFQVKEREAKKCLNPPLASAPSEE